MFTPADWDVRLLWLALTYPAKFYILCLLAGAVWTTYSLVRIAFRLRVLNRDVAMAHSPRVNSNLIETGQVLENLRQFNVLLFLLFGAFLATETLATLRAIRYASMSLAEARIDVFDPLPVFAFFVFVVLSFTHIGQWIVAAWLQSKLASITPQHD